MSFCFMAGNFELTGVVDEAAMQRADKLRGLGLASMRGDLILHVCPASACLRCGCVLHGEPSPKGCGCSSKPAMVYGEWVLYRDMDLNGEFMSHADLLLSIRAGIRLVDFQGADISCQIQPPQ